MARHKEFDRDTALHAAIGVFSEHGYEVTSTEELLTAMKISRQSMYDTFGEESEEIKGTDGAHRWIVDQLDGTTNFL
ncbi:TetR family transcriptional regulator, partial [Rhizobium leguminosarum]|uniref:TetR/AcrR family transcriptional regulator n=1 Tax=Rhizobium leguminosarum TaxID=384 RepID=UPI003F98D974